MRTLSRDRTAGTLGARAPAKRSRLGPYGSALVAAVQAARKNELGDSAAALAYYTFTALPAVLLASLGVFSLLAGRETVDAVVDRLRDVAPPEAVSLVSDGLSRAIERNTGGIAMVAVGLALAFWTATGAINALMRALNRVYGVDEQRGFVRKRVTALALLVLVTAAVALVAALLVLGGPLSGWLGRAAGAESAVQWAWWTAQWPLLLGGLVLAFAVVLRFGPARHAARLRLVTLGSLFAACAWLVASGIFSVFVSRFGSYDKTWGALAAVIVTLVWLWLGALALLFGAEVDAELERQAEGGVVSRDAQREYP